MKTIDFIEYTYVLHAYDATVEISNDDFQKLENNEITIDDIVKKYNDIDYGCSEPIYDMSYVDSLEYCGEE